MLAFISAYFYVFFIKEYFHHYTRLSRDRMRTKKLGLFLSWKVARRVSDPLDVTLERRIRESVAL